MKRDNVAFVADVIEIALEAFPSNVPPNRGAKVESRYGDTSAACHTQKLHPLTRRSVQHRDGAQRAGNNDAFSRQRSLQLVLRNFSTPLHAAVTQAILVRMSVKVWRARLVVAKNETSVFACASAVGGIVSGRRLTVVPEDFSSARFCDLAEVRVDARDAQVLAMRGVAELEAVERVAAAEVDGKGARRYRHGFEGLVGLEIGGLARQHPGDVLLHRQERGDEQMTIIGPDFNREVGAQRRLADSIHLIGATDVKLTRFCAANLKQRPFGAQGQRGDSLRLACCTSSRLCLAGFGPQMQFARRMQVPEPHPNGLREASGCFGESWMSIGSMQHHQEHADRRESARHHRDSLAVCACRLSRAWANAPNIWFAKAAASLPCPFSKKTTSTISGS